MKRDAKSRVAVLEAALAAYRGQVSMLRRDNRGLQARIEVLERQLEDLLGALNARQRGPGGGGHAI